MTCWDMSRVSSGRGSWSSEEERWMAEAQTKKNIKKVERRGKETSRTRTSSNWNWRGRSNDSNGTRILPSRLPLWKKKDRNSQSTSSEPERIDTDFRNLIEGYRPGQYIHIQLTDVPCEMINSIYPITERGLPPAEERFGITILSSLGWSFYDFSAFNSLPLPV